MRSIAIMALLGVVTTADNSFTIRPGQWSVRYEIVDVSSDMMGGRASMLVGHDWGGNNCLVPGAPAVSILDTIAYRCEVIRFSAEKGRMVATRTCKGGHAIPGFGTETIVASVRDNRFVGTSDITLVADPGAMVTRIRAVVTGELVGECR